MTSLLVLLLAASLPSPPFKPVPLPSPQATNAFVELWQRYEEAWLMRSGGWKNPRARGCLWALFEREALQGLLYFYGRWNGRLPPRARDFDQEEWREPPGNSIWAARLRESRDRVRDYCGGGSGGGPTPVYVEARRASEWLKINADEAKAPDARLAELQMRVQIAHQSQAPPGIPFLAVPDLTPEQRVALAVAIACPAIIAAAPELAPLVPTLVVP